ncbi:MAG: NAD-dependent 4,6-dehydratase LegB [Candidatus Obscuribacterales bacterium]
MPDASASTVFVTGADGFIGSHLTEQLAREGYKVRAFGCYNSWNTWGNLENCDSEIKESVEVVSGDVRDPYSVKNAMRGCDIVMHLAALIAIPYSYSSPGSYVETNVGGTLNILQAARELGVEKVVHTSTSEVYGTARFVPITEEHPLQAQSPYAATKIGADQLALSFYNSFGTPVTVVRPFNTYGPRQSARAIIPATIIQIASGKKEIKLGSLHPTRDFNFVLDTVSGFIAAARCQDANGEVVNIGSNFEISIGDTVDLIAEVMGADIKVVTDEARLRPEKSEVNRLWADNSKARKILGWEPAYGGRDGLKRGLSKTADWFLNKENLKGYKANVYNV